MGQGDAVTHAGRAEAFPLLQAVDGDRGVQAIGLRGDLAQFLKQAFLAGQMPDDPDGPRLQKLGKFHESFNSCAGGRYLLLRGSIQPMFPSSLR